MKNRLKILFLHQIAEGLTIDDILGLYILAKNANRPHCPISPTTAESRVSQCLRDCLTSPRHYCNSDTRTSPLGSHFSARLHTGHYIRNEFQQKPDHLPAGTITGDIAPLAKELILLAAEILL